MSTIINILMSAVRQAVPLLIAGLGAVFAARAGIINVGLEGFMLTGALFGVVGAYLSGSATIGALSAIASGVVLAIIFSYFSITLYANQTVVGTAINIFAAGMTVTLNRIVFGTQAVAQKIAGYEKISLPIFSKIPIIGKIVFDHPLPAYLAYLSVPFAWYFMQKTKFGLNIRAIGDNPQACDSVGIDVRKIRWLTMLFSGGMAGFAGSYISMGNLRFFVENMVAGRGFMVLAIVVMGSYSPVGVLLASLLFGTSQALQYMMQGADTAIPYQFLNMIPYLITLLSVCGLMKVRRQPASVGVPYIRE